MHFPWQAQYKRHVHQEVRALISWQMLHFGASDLQFWSILGRWFCVTGAALCMTWHHFFVAGAIRQRHGLEKWQKRIGTRPSALQFPIIEGVSQICFGFDVVNFESWGRLAELLCFWHCQVGKLWKSRRIAAFLMLSSSKIEEVSHTCFVFKLADSQERDR